MPIISEPTYPATGDVGWGPNINQNFKNIYEALIGLQEIGPLDVADDILVGGTVDGIDIAAFFAAFLDHSERHEKGDADTIALDRLGTPSDTTWLDVDNATHGLCPKLPNVATKFLNGKGSWTVPAAAGINYVDRGDPSAYDFQLGDLVTDGTYRDLDLSAIVPANAVLVQLIAIVQDDAANSWFVMRKNGNVNGYNVTGAITQAADVSNFVNLTVACDASRKIEYFATNTTWTLIRIVIRGWWLPA